MRKSFFPFVVLLFPLSLAAAGHDVSTTAARQSQPVVTGNGAGFTAGWLEEAGQLRSVVAGRVNHDGDPLDGDGISLDQKPAFSVAIAHSSSESLIVWPANGGLSAARLTLSSVQLDAVPLVITKDPASQPAVAWNGGRYFVVWSSGFQLLGAFVGTDGVVTAPKTFFNQPASDQNQLFAPDVSWDGKQFVVVFGEAPPGGPPPCTCASFPDHMRVMRVSVTGDAIDAVPVRIPGVHGSAHVASSGTESLIALDAGADTTTMIVREGANGLQFGPEVPTFHWFNGLSSDVTWDGAVYDVGWRYPITTASAGWLGVTRISRSGSVIGTLFAEAAGPPESLFPPAGASIAANDGGEFGLVTSDTTSPSPLSKVHLYLTSEFMPMPAAPTPPQNIVSYFTGSKALVEWTSAGETDGFLLEESVDFGLHWFLVDVLAPEVRTVTVPASVGNQFRVSAFGPGGLSGASITSIGSAQRHRASR